MDEIILEYEFQYDQYVEDVVSGQKLSCKKIIQACKRHLGDLKKSKRDDYPYYFDHEWAQTYISFIKGLKMHEGKYSGKYFPILPFQEWLVAMIYGWRYKKNGLRRFREAFITMAKKNAKTTLMAAIVVAQFYLEPDAAGQYIFCASSKEQANLCKDMCFNFVKEFVEEESEKGPGGAAEVTELWANNITRSDTGQYIKSVSRDGKKTEGKGANLVIVDEYHVHPSDDLKDSLYTGQKGRVDPLMLVVTTAGDSIGGVCHKQYEYCEDILNKIKEDDTLFIACFEADQGKGVEETFWKTIEAIYMANPAFGHTPEVDPTMIELQTAINKGGATQQTYKTKTLNVWVGSSTVWIPHDKWMLCHRELTHGGYGYGGLDLAFKNDLCSYVRWYPDSKSFKTTFFIPQKKVEDKEDGVDYLKWVEDGFIITAGIESLSYDTVEAYIIGTWKQDKMKAMYYDPATAHHMAEHFENAGMKTFAFAQSAGNLTAPIMSIENMVMLKTITHENNPVINWNMSNVNIKRTGNGYASIIKTEGRKKIDGIAALLNAVACGISEAPKKKKVVIRSYDENGNLINDQDESA
jgi:phage terminase large subunit-like protein